MQRLPIRKNVGPGYVFTSAPAPRYQGMRSPLWAVRLPAGARQDCIAVHAPSSQLKPPSYVCARVLQERCQPLRHAPRSRKYQ